MSEKGNENTKALIPERLEKLQNVPVLVLFGTCLFFALIFTIYAFPTCSPWFSYYGIDSWGNICSSLYHNINTVPGVNGSGKAIFGKDNVWALNFHTKSPQCLANESLASGNLVKICVSSCPSFNDKISTYDSCIKILEENDYAGDEFIYARSKCQLLNDSQEMCLASGAEDDSE